MSVFRRLLLLQSLEQPPLARRLALHISRLNCSITRFLTDTPVDCTMTIASHAFRLVGSLTLSRGMTFWLGWGQQWTNIGISSALSGSGVTTLRYLSSPNGSASYSLSMKLMSSCKTREFPGISKITHNGHETKARAEPLQHQLHASSFAIAFCSNSSDSSKLSDDHQRISHESEITSVRSPKSFFPCPPHHHPPVHRTWKFGR